ncbi:MAG: hypothetical protein DMF30_10090 [Verrucomicrobia bacterium]|nr:MAG: hypothetical protein DMF30_10090 [Verrucomicrobiota bacterium]
MYCPQTPGCIEFKIPRYERRQRQHPTQRGRKSRWDIDHSWRRRPQGSYAHIHVGFEVILYILEGKVRHAFGPGLKQVLENEAGDFIYIKPGVPHEVFNMSDTEPVVAFVARSSADEWDHIIPYDRNQPALKR